MLYGIAGLFGKALALIFTTVRTLNSLSVGVVLHTTQARMPQIQEEEHGDCGCFFDYSQWFLPFLIIQSHRSKFKQEEEEEQQQHNNNNNNKSSFSFSLIMPNDSIICKGCDLVWLIPTLTYQQAMELVGIPNMEASSGALLRQFQWQLQVKIQDRGQPKFLDDEASQAQPYKDLFHLLNGDNCSLHDTCWTVASCRSDQNIYGRNQYRYGIKSMFGSMVKKKKKRNKKSKQYRSKYSSKICTLVRYLWSKLVCLRKCKWILHLHLHLTSGSIILIRSLTCCQFHLIVDLVMQQILRHDRHQRTLSTSASKSAPSASAQFTSALSAPLASSTPPASAAYLPNPHQHPYLNQPHPLTATMMMIVYDVVSFLPPLYMIHFKMNNDDCNKRKN